MKRTIVMILSVCGLALTLVPSLLVFGGELTSRTNNLLMLLGMLLWFATAPFWVGRHKVSPEEGTGA